MMSAYEKQYLEGARENLGEAVDYVANACQMDINAFFDMFVVSGLAERFEEGEPKVVAGYSGTELAVKTFEKCGLRFAYPEPLVELEGYSPEYWCGWMLAHLQWMSGRSFSNLLANISLELFLESVPGMMEMPEAERDAALTAILNQIEEPVKIQEQRKIIGYSQRELAEVSGVNLRTLQQYEVKAKDLNKAQARTVDGLARTLGVTPADLMEIEK
ncbi:MAG: helix-turn-helix transcriptional regulator [Parasporobacterium sp.]|nr:helix-turn-helix transcriptional regulator [Parasporobacterium sp.]